MTRRSRKSLHYKKSRLVDIPTVIRPRPPDPNNPHRGPWSLIAFGPVPHRRNTWFVRQLGRSHHKEGTLEDMGKYFALLTSKKHTHVKWSNVTNMIYHSHCTHCNEFVGYGPVSNYENPRVCDGCRATLAMCSRCHSWKPKRRVVHYHNIQLCTTCLDYQTLFSICDICHSPIYRQREEVRVLNHTAPDPNTVNIVACQDCVEAYMELCSVCALPVFRGTGGLCTVCKNRELKLRPIDPKDTTYTIVPASISYSVELELCNINYRARIADTYEITSDGSVSSDGLEIRAGILYGDKGIERLKKLFEFLEETDCKADRSCGGHIHIGGELISSIDNRRKLFEAYRHMQNMMFRLVPNHRRDNRYCKKLQYDYEVHAKDGKYYWFNLYSYRYHETIEIRLAQGFDRWDRCYEWLMLHLRLFQHIVQDMKITDIKSIPTANIESYCSWLSAIGCNGEYWLKRAKIYG